jgi:hypothetical protein
MEKLPAAPAESRDVRFPGLLRLPAGNLRPPAALGVPRHDEIAQLLAKDVIERILAADHPMRAADDLQLALIGEGSITKALEVTVRVQITPADLSHQMLTRLDEALGLNGKLQELDACVTSWNRDQEQALGDLVIRVAERLRPALGDAELVVARAAAKDGAAGVAQYLIARLGVGHAFDLLAEFASEHLAEENTPTERLIG